MGKPYYERPDWILKSIVYFCDNYTINGQDLGDMKAGAIKTYGKKTKAVYNCLSWSAAPQGELFWECLYWLQGGPRLFGAVWTPSCGAKCAPWTEAEKRMIDKMPKVK